MNPFSPKDQATTSLSVGAASTAEQALSTGGASQLEITNTGTTTVFVRFGIAGMGAATIASGVTGGSYPVGAGAKVVVSINAVTTHVRAIAAAAGPSLVYFTPGEGQ